MLWNVVYEFFIKYIFGGVIQENGSPSYYGSTLGYAINGLNGQLDYENIVDYRAFNFLSASGTDYYMPLGNYLSLIATIISMVAILLFCVFIIKKIIGIIFRLFTGSSAF